ncbi:PD40 domain-containing protein [Microbispora sp. CSR-4]|uniref:NACHT and WD repeat domain-containing protein n=1 Tax=Microbispora sp. CSR-4 TaxID=2592813 RepID=UPI0016502571|nr:PD40 domain-containing protein [Microbispora sp. CSR-4]
MSSVVSGGEGVHLEAYASGEARVHQAGRDQHFHYGDGLRERQRTEAGRVTLECPYPGLAAFGREQARWFFGRDALVAELIARLDERLHAGGVQVVVGQSGAGKSSLLRAGLLSKLDEGALPGSGQWPKVVFTPTADPLQALAAQISSFTGTETVRVAEELAEDPDRCVPMLGEVLRNHIGSEDSGARVVMVVDQFEELFTLCTDDSRRRVFIDLLTRLVGTRGDAGHEVQPVGLVVVGVRADFYAACAHYSQLRLALQDSPLVVGSMSEVELREAILYPAQDVGLDIEPGLIEVLLRDLGTVVGTDEGGTAGYEAGRLPLLAHALRASWQQRHGATLTVAGYRTTGGIQRAIATTADQFFARLDAAGQRMAESLFLRLVKIGDGTEDTRRRLSRSELVDRSADPQTATAVVDAFTNARLLTQRQDTVEITHEALLHSWPQLRRWIDSDRAGRLIHQDLEEAAAAWDRGGRDSSLLYRGGRLETARTWAETAPHHDLSSAARDFLSASTRQQRRAVRLRTGTIAVLTVLSLVASTAAVFASQQQREALQQRDLAIYNRVVAEADQLGDTDGSLSAQLTLVAHRMRPGDETYTRLLTTENTALSTPLTGHASSVNTVAFSPDGHTLASASGDGSVRLWNVSDPARAVPLGRPLNGHTNVVFSVAFSPDGHTLASASGDGSVRLWNVSDPAQPAPLGRPLTGHTGTVFSVAFSPDGHTLASAGDDRSVRLWNVSDPAQPAPLGRPLTGHTSKITSVAFSPDGHTLASASFDESVRLWDVSDPARAAPLGRPLTGHTDVVFSVAFSPDGDTLASAGEDRSVRLWNVSDPARAVPLGRPLTGHTNIITSVAFSPDGRTLASAGWDRSVRLWNVSDPAQSATLGRPLTGLIGTVFSVAFSPDGHTLASASADRSIRLWNLPGSYLTGHTHAVASVAFSPDGDTLASASEDRSVRLWDVSDPARAVPLGRPLNGHTASVFSVAFSPDGDTLASAGWDRSVRLWDVSDPARAVPLGRPLTGHTNIVFSVAFSPDGHTLASAGWDRSVRLWDVSDPARAVPLGRPLTGHTNIVYSVAFSPDGHTLASASEDRSVRLWNVSDPAQPAPLGWPLISHASNAVLSVAFSPDGHTLASASADRSIRLWDVSDPAQPAPLGRPLTGHTDHVFSVAFSPDGHTLASASWDSSVRLWDVSDPARAAPLGRPLTGHTGAVYSVAFSPDGHTLASAGADRAVLLWETNVAKAIQRICAITKNNLGIKEWQRYIGDDVPYTSPCK